MFQDLLNRLIQPEPAPIADADARLALTALLVRVARSDNHYSSDEKALIDQITQDRYGLAPAEVTALRTEAEAMEGAAPDTVRFTRAIKDAVAYEDRLAVIEALWKVVLADGKRAKEEDALLRLVTNLLGISDPDSARARQRVSQ
ncbi:MAG: TerB family tellurite resistance protein [Pseudomonadota bacterium]